MRKLTRGRLRQTIDDGGPQAYVGLAFVVIGLLLVPVLVAISLAVR